jgi:hypothetical protein
MSCESCQPSRPRRLSDLRCSTEQAAKVAPLAAGNEGATHAWHGRKSAAGDFFR